MLAVCNFFTDCKIDVGLNEIKIVVRKRVYGIYVCFCFKQNSSFKKTNICFYTKKRFFLIQGTENEFISNLL